MATEKRIRLFTMITVLYVSSVATEMAPTREDKRRLYSDIFSRNVINSSMPPMSIANGSDVMVKVWPNKIAGVVDSKQTMETALTVLLSWKDEDFSWKPQDYANITEIAIPFNLMWHPSLQFANTVDMDQLAFPEVDYITVYSDGTGSMYGLIFSRTLCLFDFKYYPFDTQNCTIVMTLQGRDMYPNPVVSFENYSRLFEEIGLTSSSDEWKITEQFIEVLYTNTKVSFVLLTLTIRREQLYYIMFVLLPNYVTALLTLIVFLIPPGSGEKMSFLVSIFVSITLFLNLAGETFPRNMTKQVYIPRMAMFLVFVLVECLMAMVATTYVMRKYQEELNEEVILATRNNIDEMAQKKTNVDDRHDGKEKVDDDRNSSEDKMPTILERFVAKMKQIFGKKTLDEKYFNTATPRARGKTSKWRSDTLDRMFFLLFAIFCVPFYALVFVV